MKPKLVSLLEDKRALRLQQELRSKWIRRHMTVCEMIQERKNTLPTDVLPPPDGNIVVHPSMRAVLLDTPIDEPITDEMLNEPFEAISEIEASRQAAAKEELLAQLKALKQSDMLTTADLDLAALLFKCGTCSKWITYPHILFHSCCSTDRQAFTTKEYGTLQCFIEVTDQRPWTNTVKEVGLQLIGDIVRACGLNPDVATQQEMDELDPMLEQPEVNRLDDIRIASCKWLSEEDRKRKRVAYGWRQAVQVCCCGSLLLSPQHFC